MDVVCLRSVQVTPSAHRARRARIGVSVGGRWRDEQQAGGVWARALTGGRPHVRVVAAVAVVSVPAVHHASPGSRWRWTRRTSADRATPQAAAAVSCVQLWPPVVDCHTSLWSLPAVRARGVGRVAPTQHRDVVRAADRVDAAREPGARTPSPAGQRHVGEGDSEVRGYPGIVAAHRVHAAAACRPRTSSRPRCCASSTQ